MIYPGACHCEAIAFAYETALAPTQWAMRACGCRFCRMHNATMTADPGGALALRCRDLTQLSRYRFGLRSADFWVCRSCGVFVGVVNGEGDFGIVNVHALLERPAYLPEPTPMSYDGETVERRTQRWRERWTPICS